MKFPRIIGPGRIGRGLWLLALAAAANLFGGCAALTNPVANGVPVRRLPNELLAESKEDFRPIPLTMLRQVPDPVYKVGPGDVLGIWVEGVLGEKGQLPPVQQGQPGQTPAMGLPIVVRDDGYLPLPLVEPEKVEGMTLGEIEAVVLKAYAEKKKIIIKDQARILATLLKPRQYHVLVIREDAGSFNVTLGSNTGFGGGGVATGSYRGVGYSLDLPAGENDVLNALARTGGLPGLEGKDEVIIQRGRFKDAAERELYLKELTANRREADQIAEKAGVQIIRIPLRLKPGQVPSFKPSDVILQSGDIVLIEAKQLEVFYTGGLLPAGEYVLPRNYDLDLVEAISRISGPLVSGGIQGNNFFNSSTVTGLRMGNPSPSLVSVIRKTPNGGQVTIRVDLNRALQDPRENILLAAGDKVFLQETPGEAMARYFTQVFTFNINSIFWQRQDSVGTGALVLP